MESFSRDSPACARAFSDALFALTAMVAVVLLVTCANIANLVGARGGTRAISHPISLGASNGRLIRQCLAESLTLAAAGGAAGVVRRMGERLSRIRCWPRRVRCRRPFAGHAGVDVRDGPVAGDGARVRLAPALRAIQVGRIAAAANQRGEGVNQVAARGMQSLVVGQLRCRSPSPSRRSCSAGR
jgi:hypothetical protein